VLGKHEGILHYTIGQRRGLGIAAGEPLYVVALDAPRRRVVVGPREALATPFVHLRDFNWIGPGLLEDLPHKGLKVGARVRSTRPPAPAHLFADGHVAFASPESGVSPGQACVLYDSPDPHARVLGGGFIAARPAA
jgi:tRNA-specific 2-thiouridylase